MQSTWPIWIDPRPATPGVGLVLSLILHSLAICIALFQISPQANEQPAAEDRRRVTPLFLPAGTAEKRSLAERKRRNPLYPSLSRQEPVDRHETAEVKVEPRVDLNAVELSFEDDGLNALPDVVREYNGVFALTDKREPAFTHYVLDPPDWAVREVTLDMSGRLRFTLSPADKWEVLRAAAQRYSLDLNSFNVSALFERPYGRCLQQAIRERAMAADMGANRRVKSARLAFAAGRPCGVEVVAISTAAAI